MNGHAPTSNDQPLFEQLAQIRKGGIEKTLFTGRTILLKSVQPADLLRTGDCPDILTPVLMRCIYGDPNEAVKEFVNQEEHQTEHSISDALKYLETIDRVAVAAIADGTDIADLTLEEKKLIFRLALGSAEMLVLFRYEAAQPLAALAQGDNVSQVAE